LSVDADSLRNLRWNVYVGNISDQVATTAQAISNEGSTTPTNNNGGNA